MFCTSSRIYSYYTTQVITHRHRKQAAAVQSAERVFSRLQSIALWELRNYFYTSNLQKSVDSQVVDADRAFFGRCVAGAVGEAGAWFILTAYTVLPKLIGVVIKG